jgi:AAA ATPase domain
MPRSTSSVAVANLWKPYGLRSSPFFQNELRAGDPTHPVSLFVGRDEEARRVQRRVTSDPATRTIVQGSPGVGKTSFVNWLKSELSAHGVVTYEHPIRINADSTRLTFVADVLRTVTRIRSASGRSNRNNAFWERTARYLEGAELVGGSVSLHGFGMGVTRSYAAPQAPADSLYEHLGQALEQLQDELSAPILLHVNNMENLEDPAATAILMRDLRDYLLLEGAHWIFVGALGIEDDVFRVYTQVSGIFPAAETLQPLASPEIAQLLERRYEHLKIPGQRYIAPVEPSAAAELYRLFQGDLRNFLRLLGDASERELGLHGAQPMTAAAIVRSVSADYALLLQRQIGEGDFASLAKIVAAHEGADPEFRVTDAAYIMKYSQSAASQFVERLLQQRILLRTRSEGRSVYYRPIGTVLVALGVTPQVLSAAPVAPKPRTSRPRKKR